MKRSRISQKLDGVRKVLKSNDTAVIGLGEESKVHEVETSRIMSSESAHYILVKGADIDGQSSQDENEEGSQASSMEAYTAGRREESGEREVEDTVRYSPKESMSVTSSLATVVKKSAESAAVSGTSADVLELESSSEESEKDEADDTIIIEDEISEKRITSDVTKQNVGEDGQDNRVSITSVTETSTIDSAPTSLEVLSNEVPTNVAAADVRILSLSLAREGETAVTGKLKESEIPSAPLTAKEAPISIEVVRSVEEAAEKKKGDSSSSTITVDLTQSSSTDQDQPKLPLSHAATNVDLTSTLTTPEKAAMKELSSSAATTSEPVPSPRHSPAAGVTLIESDEEGLPLSPSAGQMFNEEGLPLSPSAGQPSDEEGLPPSPSAGQSDDGDREEVEALMAVSPSEAQEQLGKEVEQLERERTRQSRAAASVSNQMYKEAQVCTCTCTSMNIKAYVCHVYMY